MKNIRQEIAEILSAAVPQLTKEQIADMIEIPADNANGDYAFPCFKLAKELRKAPPLIAADVAAQIGGNALFEKVQNVNAYVNMFINKKAFAEITLSAALEAKDRFGGSELGAGKTVIVEYSSPNIAKPFHIGHIRTTVIGNSLYKIFDFLGYNVVRMNHLGDYGTQFGKMIVAYRLWGNEEDVRRDPIKTLVSYYIRFHKEAENDPSLEDKAREAFYNLEHGAEDETKLWQWFRSESLKEFKRVYDIMDIDFDSYLGESFYTDKMPAVIEELKEKGLLVPSQGAEIVDLEPYGLTPAVIRKSDGSSLYITRDLASLLYRKKTWDFDKCIYVVGAPQELHFRQLFKIVELMGYDWAKDSCVHVPFGVVNFDGAKLSTREGNVVYLEDVLNAAVEKTREIVIEKGVNTDDVDETSKVVGVGAVLFQELSAGRIKDYSFTWDKVLNFDGETGPYVQYTHARAASVLRNAGVDVEKLSAESLKNADLSFVLGESAYELIKLIYRFPEAVLKAAEGYEPSDITRHIVDVAQGFNKFYHDEHILVDNEAERSAKLLLTFAAKQTIKNGLALLGVKAPEKM